MAILHFGIWSVFDIFTRGDLCFWAKHDFNVNNYECSVAAIFAMSMGVFSNDSGFCRDFDDAGCNGGGVKDGRYF